MADATGKNKQSSASRIQVGDMVRKNVPHLDWLDGFVAQIGRKESTALVVFSGGHEEYIFENKLEELAMSYEKYHSTVGNNNPSYHPRTTTSAADQLSGACIPKKNSSKSLNVSAITTDGGRKESASIKKRSYAHMQNASAFKIKREDADESQILQVHNEVKLPKTANNFHEQDSTVSSTIVATSKDDHPCLEEFEDVDSFAELTPLFNELCKTINSSAKGRKRLPKYRETLARWICKEEAAKIPDPPSKHRKVL
jgi:hypothetical protein